MTKKIWLCALVSAKCYSKITLERASLKEAIFSPILSC